MIKFAELSGLGFNVLTLSFAATMAFTLLQVIAFLKQNKRILKTRSGESVSFSFYSYYGFALLSLTIFGLSKQSLALSINGLVGILPLTIAANISRFKKINRKEKVVGAVSALALPTMIFSPDKDFIFLVLGLVIGATLFIQVMEIWRNRSTGSYHSTQIFVSIASSTFWLIYAVILNIWAMQITSSLFLLLWLTLLSSYLKFKKIPV